MVMEKCKRFLLLKKNIIIKKEQDNKRDKEEWIKCPKVNEVYLQDVCI